MEQLAIPMMEAAEALIQTIDKHLDKDGIDDFISASIACPLCYLNPVHMEEHLETEHNVQRNSDVLLKLWNGQAFAQDGDDLQAKPQKVTSDTQTDPDIFFKIFCNFELEDCEHYYRVVSQTNPDLMERINQIQIEYGDSGIMQIADNTDEKPAEFDPHHFVQVQADSCQTISQEEFDSENSVKEAAVAHTLPKIKMKLTKSNDTWSVPEEHVPKKRVPEEQVPEFEKLSDVDASNQGLTTAANDVKPSNILTEDVEQPAGDKISPEDLDVQPFDTNELWQQMVAENEINENDRSCTHCNYKSKSKFVVVNHVRYVHHKIKDFECKLCHEKMIWLSRKSHMKLRHPEYHYSTAEKAQPADKQPEPVASQEGPNDSAASFVETSPQEPGTSQEGPNESAESFVETSPQEPSNEVPVTPKIKEELISEEDKESQPYDCNEVFQQMVENNEIVVADKSCAHCKYSYNSKSQIVRHIRYVHHKVKDYECKICHEKISWKTRGSHMKSKHPEAVTNQADINNSPAKTITDTSPSKADNSPSKQPWAPVTPQDARVEPFDDPQSEIQPYDTKEEFQKMVENNEVVEATRTCGVCGYKPTKPCKAEIVRHVRYVHQKVLDYECRVCHEVIAYRQRRQHMKRHSSNGTPVARQLEFQADATPSPAGAKSVSAASLTEKSSHLTATSMTEDISPPTPPSVTENNIPAQKPCELPAAPPVKVEILEEKAAPDPGDELQALINQNLISEDELRCVQCGYRANKRASCSDIVRHVREKHRSAQRTTNFDCDVCNVKISSQGALNAHKRKFHSGFTGFNGILTLDNSDETGAEESSRVGGQDQGSQPSQPNQHRCLATGTTEDITMEERISKEQPDCSAESTSQSEPNDQEEAEAPLEIDPSALWETRDGIETLCSNTEEVEQVVEKDITPVQDHPEIEGLDDQPAQDCDLAVENTSDVPRTPHRSNDGGLTREDALWQKMVAKNLANENISCGLCGFTPKKKKRSQAVIIRHVYKVHLREFQCQVCVRQFLSQGELEHHQRIDHSPAMVDHPYSSKEAPPESVKMSNECPAVNESKEVDSENEGSVIQQDKIPNKKGYQKEKMGKLDVIIDDEISFSLPVDMANSTFTDHPYDGSQDGRLTSPKADVGKPIVVSKPPESSDEAQVTRGPVKPNQTLLVQTLVNDKKPVEKKYIVILKNPNGSGLVKPVVRSPFTVSRRSPVKSSQAVTLPFLLSPSSSSTIEISPPAAIIPSGKAPSSLSEKTPPNLPKVPSTQTLTGPGDKVPAPPSNPIKPKPGNIALSKSKVVFCKRSRESEDPAPTPAKRMKVDDGAPLVGEPSEVRKSPRKKPTGIGTNSVSEDPGFQSFAMGRCSFRCRLCDRTGLQSYDDLLRHVKENHDMDFADYRKKFDNSYDTKKVYKCQICQEHVVWDQMKLVNHMSKKHKLTLESYYNQYETKSTRA